MFRGIPYDRLIFLIRHAESEKNLLDYHGHNPSLDHPLTKAGLAEAKAFGIRLTDQIHLSTVVASPSLSATQTANALATPHGLGVEIRQNLRAVHMGILSHLTDAQIKDRHPDLHEELRRFQAGQLHPRDMTIPGREEFMAFSRRISAEFRALNNKEFPLAVIAHHSSLNMILNIINPSPGTLPDTIYRRYKFPNLSSTLIEAGPKDSKTWILREIAVLPPAIFTTPLSQP